jgi:hypothetical protein
MNEFTEDVEQEPVEPFDVIDPEHGLRVCKDRCSTCIFRPGNLMDLSPGRVQRMVRDHLDRENAIICHDTLSAEAQAVCRGFFDAYDTNPIQIAKRLGWFVEVDPSEQKAQ